MMRTSSSSTSWTFSCCEAAQVSVTSSLSCFAELPPCSTGMCVHEHPLLTYRSGDGLAIAVRRVVVARVELVADEGRAAAADVLDLGQLRVLDHTTRGVARIRSQDDTGATSDLLRNLVRVNVVVILFGERDGDRSELEIVHPRVSVLSPSSLAYTDEAGNGSLHHRY